MVLALAAVLLQRPLLDMDELHTLLLARLMASGEVPGFYVGGFSRYEGGSWLIGFPVALLLKLGLSGPAATSWAAGGVAAITAAAGALWLRRHGPRGSALWLGPVAASIPLLLHYSYRAWGSLSEALVALPLLALLGDAWLRRGKPRAWLPLLGLGLSGALILSYLHGVTALTFAAARGLEGWRERRLGRAVRDVLVVALVATAGLALWILGTNPHPGESLHIREGRSLGWVLGRMVAPPLLDIVAAWPRAWAGELARSSALTWVAGAGLTGLTVYGAAVAWRRGGALRWPVLFAGIYLLALGVGHGLVGGDAVYRYYLPLLAVSALLITVGGPWPSAAAVALGVGLRLTLAPTPVANPAATHVALGAQGLQRNLPDPHVKYLAFLRAASPGRRGWLSYGYGLDSGLRYSRKRAGMIETLAGVPDREAVLRRDSNFSLVRALAWLPAFPQGADPGPYWLGFGVGLWQDRRLDRREVELVDVLPPTHRAALLRGVGAALHRQLDADDSARADGWDALLRPRLTLEDWEHIGEGMAAVTAGGQPDPGRLGLPAGELRDALQRGQQAARHADWNVMVRLPVLPTPAMLGPLPEESGINGGAR